MYIVKFKTNFVSGIFAEHKQMMNPVGVFVEVQGHCRIKILHYSHSRPNY